MLRVLRHLSAGQALPYVVAIAAHPAVHADTRRTLLDSDHRQLRSRARSSRKPAALRRPVAT